VEPARRGLVNVMLSKRERADREFAKEIAALRRRGSPRCPTCFLVRETLPRNFSCEMSRCPKEFKKIPLVELQRSLVQLEKEWSQRWSVA